MQGDGNIVLYTAGWGPLLWKLSNVWPRRGRKLVLQGRWESRALYRLRQCRVELAHLPHRLAPQTIPGSAPPSSVSVLKMGDRDGRRAEAGLA